MKKENSYHHGDLRAALLKAAELRLEKDGYEALSLRELARDIGVAASAPYFHFKNRDTLFAALIQISANDLTRRYRKAAVMEGSAQDRLAAACRSYLDFAQRKPELFRLTFVAPVVLDPTFQGDVQLAIDQFDALVAALMQSSDRQAITATSVACWSTMHGFAMLRLHKRLVPAVATRKTEDVVVAAVLRQASGK